MGGLLDFVFQICNALLVQLSSALEAAKMNKVP
jgi:hypothetical protein